MAHEEPIFQPEYFSGLNWKDTENLVGKVVEYSKDGGYWQGPGTLIKVSTVVGDYQRFLSNLCWWAYIRTCPETYAHPTITIGGVKLPRPEVEEPQNGDHVWIWAHSKIAGCIWDGTDQMTTLLINGLIHLAEARAQAWADWWENTVMAEVKK